MAGEPSLKILRAEHSHLDLIRRLAHLVWPDTYKNILSGEQISYMLDLFYSRQALLQQFEEHIFLMAFINDKAVGFASYSMGSQPDIYKIHKIYVLPSTQGKGIGKVMIDRIAHTAADAGGNFLQLNVNRKNKARMFYERLGFLVITEEDIPIGNGYFMTDYVMQKRL